MFELTGGGSPRHLNTFSNLFIATVHYTHHTCYVVLLWLTVPCSPCCPLHTHQYMLCSVTIVACTMYTIISTHAIIVAMVACTMYTMLSSTRTSTHAIVVAMVACTMYTMLSTTHM